MLTAASGDPGKWDDITMLQPFIDTRNFHALRLACNVVTYSHKFCLRTDNRYLIASLTGGDPNTQVLVDVLRQAQEKLAPNLPLTGLAKIWERRQDFMQQVGIETMASVGEPTDVLVNMEHRLNQMLLEAVLTTIPTESSIEASPADVVRLACQCLWLSELLALAILGVATVLVDDEGACAVHPASDGMRQHLRRLWFGSAFEQASLVAGSAAIQILAAVAADPSRRDQLSEARVSALTVFPQHWRLPVDTGPISELLFDSLEPLLMIIIHAIVASQDSRVPPFDHRHAAEKNITEVYQAVMEIQEQLPVVDRLFEFSGNGLVLGTRDLASAAIEMAERLAEKKLGSAWHGNVTSGAQKAYLLERIGRCEHIEILDFELLQHHSTDNVDLDVDFFIRDKMHGQIYGVQLKHLKKRTRGGLLAWLGQFRERENGLGNLVRQLENLTELARTDEKCRSFLISQGLTDSECDRIVPVGLHNVGFVDFWSVQNGVHLYDLHTFANVLAGRVAFAVGIINGRVIHDGVGASEGLPPSPHKPDSVIAAYLTDPLFLHLANFDMAANVSRKATLSRATIVAHGLGL